MYTDCMTPIVYHSLQKFFQRQCDDYTLYIRITGGYKNVSNKYCSSVFL